MTRPAALARRLRAVHASPDEGRWAEEVCAAARELVGADAVLLLRAVAAGTFAPWDGAPAADAAPGPWRPAPPVREALAAPGAVSLAPPELEAFGPGAGGRVCVALAAGITAGTGTAAVLVAGRADSRPFSPGDQAALADLAAHAGDALGRARAAARQAERLGALAELGRQLGEAGPPDELLRTVAAAARRLLGADAATCRLVEGAELRLAACAGEAAELAGPPGLRIGEGQTGEVAALARPVLLGEARSNGRARAAGGRELGARGVGSYAGAPLVARGAVLGVLCVYARDVRRFTEEDASVLAGLAAHAALACDRARLDGALREAQDLSVLGRLAAGVAHELNNPLAVVIGTVDLLRKDAPDARGAERLRRIADQARRAIRIARSLVVLARREPAPRTAVELGGLLDEALELAGYELRRARVVVARRDDPALPAVLADRGQLQQVFAHLVLDAVLSIPETGAPRTLTVTAHHDAAADRVVVSIAVDGPGVPAGDVQGAAAALLAAPAGQGPGAGLGSSRQAVESHGGRLRVERGAGAGTRAVVELPAHRDRPRPPAEAPAWTAPATLGARALLVEDERVVGDLLAEFLALDGYEVDRAANGREALDLARGTAYALIVSDVRMPDVDGPAFYRELRAMNPELARRVVFVTGDLMRPETRGFLDATCLRYLEKPFTLLEFRTVIRGIEGARPPPRR